jgi:hypothetical protein
MRKLKWRRRTSKTNGFGKSTELITSYLPDGLSIIRSDQNASGTDGTFEALVCE